MFEPFLSTHQVVDLITNQACLFPTMEDRARWEAVSEEMKQEMDRVAAKYHDVPYPMCTATQFMAFVRTGSRVAWEKPYFDRRRKLCASLIACCLHGDDRELDAVIDGIWCICEESSWVISAHNGSSHDGMRPAAERPLPDIENPYVDLFAAQTAMILSFTIALMGKRLDQVAPVLRRRVELEIERRILVPFMTRDDFWWMGMIRKDLCNWTPWIVSNVMLTAWNCVHDRIRLGALLTRACRMLDRYLDVIPEDGGCDEGAGYWNMAGGALCDCLEVLDCLTGGKMTFWDDQKVRNFLSFPVKVRLTSTGWYVNFADCDAKPYLSGERLRYIGEKLADRSIYEVGVEIGSTLDDQLSDTPQLWRLLKELFHPAKPLKPGAPVPEKDIFFPNLQLRVLERNGMILAAKGGHNGESHNHNDVGAFILCVNNEPVVVDAGNMVYTAKTFSDERYTLWNIRSCNHNVPMIDGIEQAPGTAFHADAAASTPDGIMIDFESAYPAEAALTACQRTLALDRNALTMTDYIRTKTPKAITWVLMLRYEPKKTGSALRSGPLKITATGNPEISWQEIPVTDTRMARNFPGSLWRVTFTVPAAAEHNMTIRIKKEECL